MTPSRRGFTLIEMIVVLAVMALAVALVLPALRTPGPRTSGLQAILTSARAAAANRGELIYVRIEPTGAWHMEGGGSPLEGELTRGRIDALSTVPLTLIVSPVGSCAFDVRSAAAGAALSLDPLTCELISPPRPSSS
ncbi:MAG TPA: prepilin-type N-terminal cleavage/methylation domain-containing protein [Gemmatimonadaceae bacterium]|jgi:prepilin-type N-terminal cleavage/methylation domain-containing protein|nr:prepilin-type N-terminal cleavage/methylation domain-containing protein [Gemmatimonadaceae bacterium]